MVKQMQKLGVKARCSAATARKPATLHQAGGRRRRRLVCSAAGAPKEQLPGYASFAES